MKSIIKIIKEKPKINNKYERGIIFVFVPYKTYPSAYRFFDLFNDLKDLEKKCNKFEDNHIRYIKKINVPIKNEDFIKINQFFPDSYQDKLIKKYSDNFENEDIIYIKYLVIQNNRETDYPAIIIPNLLDD